MLGLLLVCCESADDGPTLPATMPQGFNDWNYSTVTTCNLDSFTNYYCVCNAGRYWRRTESGAECVDQCTNTNETSNTFGCFTDAEHEFLESNFSVAGVMHFHDLISEAGGNPTSLDVTMPATVQQDLSLSAKKCASMKDHKGCNHLSNLCVAAMYDRTSTACAYFDTIFASDTAGNQWNNFNWPRNKPFLRYTDTFRHAIDDPIIKSSWSNGQVLQIYLGVFAKDGQFKGLKKLEADLQKCRNKNDVEILWQKLGYSYTSQCVFDLFESFESDTTDFYDPFIVENISGIPYLRPIGVLVKNYYDQGVAVNRGSEEFWALQRRFFLFDNHTTTDYLQYVKNISLVFEFFSNHRELKVPYFVVDYVQVSRAAVESASQSAPFLLDKETLSHPGFAFSVLYTAGIGGFWDAVVNVFIVLAMLGITYWVVHVFLYIRSYGYGGRDCNTVFALISSLLNVIATVLFIMLIAFSMYYLWLYKWTKSIKVLLPYEGEFFIFSAVLWVTMAFKLVAMVIQVILQTNCDCFLIDWEEPRKRNADISAWRRIMIANEWNKISAVRACSVSFTLIFMVFLLDGLNLQLMGAPIPTTALIDVGNTYAMIRFAFTTFVWLIVFLIQWLLIRFVYWKIVGDPFENFMRLCYASNISVMLLPQRSHGFYIHGKNARRITDVGHQTVNDNFDTVTMEEEEQASDSDGEASSELSFAAPFKGLNPMEPDRQVQEIYLSTDCFHYIQDKYYSMKLEVTRKRKNGVHDPAPYATYETTNIFLKKFFSQNGCEHLYTFQPYSYVQMIDSGPVVEESSIFTTAPNFLVKHTMLYGIQGSLMILYLLLFSAIDTATEKPCIAGFVVFVVDVIVKLLFKHRGRANLANKALVDPRFILT